MNGEPRKEEADKVERLQGKGNDTPERAPVVSDTLKHAAARLLVSGPPPLRTTERWGAGIALHILQEKSSITDWVDQQRLSGHNDREARTIARSVELGVHQYGAGYLASKPCEVALRRLLAISMAAPNGSIADAWRAASKLEGLPGDTVGAMLLQNINKRLRDSLKRELQVELMMAGELPPKEK